MDITQIATFLGWCSIINMGILIYSSIMLIVFNDFVKRIHNKILKVELKNVDTIYFNFLGNYKLAIIIFNLVPYFALKIME